MLDDKIMKEFSLSGKPGTFKPNSHLSLLSMVDAWSYLGINPYDNLICQTRPLEEFIQTALYDKSIRNDDLEFHSAVREWSSIIFYGDLGGGINSILTRPKSFLLIV